MKYGAKVDGDGIVIATIASSLETLPAGYLDVTNESAATRAAIEARLVHRPASTWLPAPAPRVISARAFLGRLTVDEETALEQLAADDARVAVILRRIAREPAIDLDAADTVSHLAYLKSVGVPDVWPTTSAATARIAALRA